MNAGREGDGLLSAMHALYGGDEEKAYALLPADEELTAHEAATFGREKRLRALLDADADPNGQGEGGFTALDTAVQNEDEDLIALLLSRGADPEIGAGIARERLKH